LIVLDTNILSELMREKPDPVIRRWMGRFDLYDLWTTAISQAEVMVGIELLPAGRRRQGLDDAAGQLFEKLLAGRVLPFTGEAARRYAEIVGLRTRRGSGVATLDLMIAAIAATNGAAVATRNISDFEDCGVVLHDPWQDG
jgi:toxin FitB